MDEGGLSDAPGSPGDNPAKGAVTAPSASPRVPRENVRSLPPVLVRVRIWVSCAPEGSVEWRVDGATPTTGGRSAKPSRGTSKAGWLGSSLARISRPEAGPG